MKLIKNRIKSITKITSGSTFDIEMPNVHNFVLANGIISHNSHSAAYSILSYYGMWFKSIHPLEFWTVSLQYTDSSMEMIHRISEMKKNNPDITIKPPSVNISTTKFECNPDLNSIYYSLSNIKGLGEATVQKIIDERDKNGLFKSYKDFTDRIPKKSVTKASITALILSGSFDDVESIDKPRERFALLKRHWLKNEDEIPEKFNVPEVSKDYYWLLIQRELCGYGTINYRELLINSGRKELAKIFLDPDKFFKAKDYTLCAVAGLITFVVEKTTKQGKPFCIVELVSNNDIIKCMLWSEVLAKHEELIPTLKDKVVAITGKAKMDDYSGTQVLYTQDDSVIVLL